MVKNDYRDSIDELWLFFNDFGKMGTMRIFEQISGFVTHKLVRATFMLQLGGVAGTLVQAIAGIFIARILKPEFFGQYALAFSVASISSIFIGGALTDAIAPTLSRAWARGDGDRIRQAVGFYFKFLSICAAITCGVLAILPLITSRLYSSAIIGEYATVIVVASILSTIIFSFTQISLQVAGRIRTLTGLTFADVVVRYGSVLVLIGLGFGVWGAVAGHFIGAVVVALIASALYSLVVRASGEVPSLYEIPRLAYAASWKPLLRSTLLVLADSNIAMLYGALPVAMVGLFVSGAPLAYFKLAFGYMVLAMSVMGPISTVMNVHFPTIQTTEPHKLRSLFARVTFSAIVLSSTVTVVVLILAPWVFRFLYGVEFMPAVQYVYQFAVFGALFGLGVGLGPLWRSLGMVRVSIVINATMLALGVPFGLWLISSHGLGGAVVMVTTWYTISHIISFSYLYWILGKPGLAERVIFQ